MGSIRVAARTLFCAAILSGSCIAFGPRAEDTPLTKEQIKEFLRPANVINSKTSSKGVTHPSRLTLSNGTITHDASFQTVDVHKSEMKLESGVTVLNFIDSYKFNIAAYELAELIGMDTCFPFTWSANGRATRAHSAGGFRRRWMNRSVSRRSCTRRIQTPGTSRCIRFAF